MTTLLAFLVLAGVACHVMTPEERERLARGARARLLRLLEAATNASPAGAPLRDALRARTRWPLVTPALVAVNAAVFLLMLCRPRRARRPGHARALGRQRRPADDQRRVVAPRHDDVRPPGTPSPARNRCRPRSVGSHAGASRRIRRVRLGVCSRAGVLAGVVSLSTSAVAVSVGRLRCASSGSMACCRRQSCGGPSPIRTYRFR